ncbi:MAG: type VI secretion system-associated protein TagF [Rhodanobacteraceae bacterium]
MNVPGGVGFFGKLPGMGDFVQRRLPAAFVSVWDSRFEAAVNAARAEFGDAWRGVWQAAPAWRFALMPGVCGAPAWVGVTGPSVDRVGRGFPMVLACPLTDADVFSRVVRTGAGWFDALERAWGGAEMTPAAELFDVVVAGLPSPSDWLAEVASTRPTPIDWTHAGDWRMAWQAAGDDPQLSTWLGACMAVEDGCLWWTRGGARVPPGALLTRGLPRPDAYAAFLDATRAAEHWRTSGAFKATPALATPAPAPMIAAASVAMPDDLDDVLGDLLPKVQPDFDTSDATIPGAMPVATTLEKSMPAPPPVDVEPAGPSVVFKHAGAISLLAADNGPSGPRRHAATRIAAAMTGSTPPANLREVRERLQALHPSLRERTEDLINPVPEDGAALVVHVANGQAGLLRVGAASAWHWRRGRLRPLFDGAPPPPDQADTARPGDLTTVLSSARLLPMPGLGASEQPHCDEIACLVAPGDRLLLLATDTLLRIPAEALAASLETGTSEEARGRIAAIAGLGTDRGQWPLAVIEVGTT